MTDRWLHSALTNDALVAELLLQAKHSADSDSDSLRPLPPPSTSVSKTLPPRWGHRKYRSKSGASTAAAGKEHRGSPTTHLSWSGGSTSDGYDESSRPSDLQSAYRSLKVNEGASTSSYNNFEKRKVNEQELTSMRVTLNQNQRNKMRVTGDHERKMKLTCRVEAKTEAPHRGFVLPDLNMTPNEDDLMMS